MTKSAVKGKMELSTASEVASEIGVHKSTVNRIARDYQLGIAMGNQRVYTPSDVERIKQVCKFARGNPNFAKKL